VHFEPQQAADVYQLVHVALTALKHLHNVETLFYYSQAFLSVDFKSGDHISALK